LIVHKRESTLDRASALLVARMSEELNGLESISADSELQNNADEWERNHACHHSPPPAFFPF
jgi:hypothetical protein